VERIEDLFDMAEVLAKQPRAHGSRLTIITNAGGPGVLATDALLHAGATLATLSSATVEALDQILPPHWSHSNPIDILGDAEPERYARTLDIALHSSDTDGLLLILTPQAMTDPTATASRVVESVNHTRIPVLASWMGGAEVDAGEAILNQAVIPTYRYPDQAARIFGHLWQFSDNLRGLYETPILPFEDETLLLGRQQVSALLQEVHLQQRTLLTEAESKQILAAYGIPTVPTRVAQTVSEALQWAEELGYPVVLKLHSYTITHKSDVGGVRLNLQHPSEVEQAFTDIQTAVATKAGSHHFQGVTVQPMIPRAQGYELIVGCSQDPQFGPVLLFGSGGHLVEILKDQALALPPLNSTLARRLMERTQIYQALQGTRGQAAMDLAQLEQLLVNFSRLVVEQPQIQDIEINPLFVSSQGFWGLDARVILHPPQIPLADLPRPVIRPYPSQYVKPWMTQQGLEVWIRPIRPEDEPLLVEFHKTLSEETIYRRYFHLIKLSHRIAHERLTRICFNDYDREIALVVDYKDRRSHDHQVLAVGRLSKVHGLNEAEFGLLVHDSYQQQGIGTELLRRLVQIGRDEGLAAIRADILTENRPMQQICRTLGFSLTPVPAEAIVKANLVLE
jgi:acetyltransferase